MKVTRHHFCHFLLKLIHGLSTHLKEEDYIQLWIRRGGESSGHGTVSLSQSILWSPVIHVLPTGKMHSPPPQVPESPNPLNYLSSDAHPLN